MLTKKALFYRLRCKTREDSWALHASSLRILYEIWIIDSCKN